MRYYVTSGNLAAFPVEAASPLSAAKKAVIQAKPNAIGILVRVSDKSVITLQPNDYVFRSAEVLSALGLPFDHAISMEKDIANIDKEIDEEDDQ